MESCSPDCGLKSTFRPSKADVILKFILSFSSLRGNSPLLPIFHQPFHIVFPFFWLFMVGGQVLYHLFITVRSGKLTFKICLIKFCTWWSICHTFMLVTFYPFCFSVGSEIRNSIMLKLCYMVSLGFMLHGVSGVYALGRSKLLPRIQGQECNTCATSSS